MTFPSHHLLKATIHPSKLRDEGEKAILNPEKGVSTVRKLE
jgi:hypothetical protein